MPPQRTKRKIKIAPVEPTVASSGATETTNDVTISQQKRLPPPPPLEKCQRNNSGYVKTRQLQCDTTASCSRAESGRHDRKNCATDTASGRIEAKPRDDATPAKDDWTSSNSANDDPIAKSIVSKPFLSFLDVASSKRKASNKYPSLFFTMRDFENVVSDTWNRNDSADFDDLEQNLHEEEPKAPMLDDNSDVCFRMTMTNLPFEKCLGRWRDPSDDDDFARQFDDCRFKDSTSEIDRITDEKSSDYDIFDNKKDSKCRVGTRVRFAIESPSRRAPSKRDSDVKIGVPCDSSRSCESIPDDEQTGAGQSVASSVKLTEIREEFANVKDRRDNTRDKSYASSVVKGNSATGENDPFIMASANKVDAKLKAIPQTHCSDRNNDVNCKRIRDESSELISRSVQAGDEILKTGKENIITSVTRKAIASKEYDAKQVGDQSNTSSEVAGNAHRVTDESLETACKIEETAKITRRTAHWEEKMFIKKPSDDIKEKCVAKNERVHFDESPQNFLNKRNNDGTSENSSTENLINKSVERTRLLPDENKARNDSFVDSKNKYETVSPSEDIFAKSIPVKVRRNSFLETMLSEDLTDIAINCATISAVASLSMDKELSATNKSPDKIQKLDTDVTTESQHSHDFYNAIKMDAKRQKVSKNSKKTEERIVKTSNVRSMQTVSKSVSDVKNDVLNELLCNFNNIKLKIVSPENKKSAAKIGGDENIFCPNVIDSGISKGKQNASKSFEKSRSEICSVPVSTKIIDVYNDAMIVEKIAREGDLTKTKIEEKPQNLKNDTPAVNEKITKNRSNEMKKPNKSCNIKGKIVRENSKMKIDKNFSDIEIEEINVKTRIEKMSEGTKSAFEPNQESKKSRAIRVPKTILKKTSVECEQRQVSEFQQKRILIGAPVTMNKIFDSREFKAIADASRKNSLNKNGRKREKASREIHTRGEEKTDEVIADEADEDRRRIVNRSALALVESSSDKCAIARKKTTSVNPCNNNDNNRAVTPVANVSNDQSFCDVVTITPGKVRSFVKYYEIRGDTTTVGRHSKINDREKVARRKFTKSQEVPARNWPEVMIKKRETKGGDGNVKSNDCDLPGTFSNRTQPSTFAPRVQEDPLKNPVCKTTKMGSKIKEYERSGSHVSDKETCAPFAKTGAKKSVQFLDGFTVIHSKTFGEEESARTVADRDTNTSRKRRAPGVPPSQNSTDYRKLVCEIAKLEKSPNVKEGSLRRQEDVTQIRAVTNHVQNSGINHFVLKSEAPQLVFYCTI